MSGRERIRGWRKIAAAAWGPPNDPQIYGDLELDATEVLAFMDLANQNAGLHVTMTTMVGRALAKALADHPDLNVRMYRGNIIRRETVDIFFIVSAEEGSELSGVKVVDADKKGAVAIARELGLRARSIRAGDDNELGKTKRVIGSTPRWLLGSSIKISSWLTTDRDLDLKRFGLPRQAFGSTIVSSVGMFGVQRAYAPLAGYYRVPFLVLVGEVADKPVAVEKQVVVRPMLTLTATMDHRYIDGYHAARLARSVREYFARPGVRAAARLERLLRRIGRFELSVELPILSIDQRRGTNRAAVDVFVVRYVDDPLTLRAHRFPSHCPPRWWGWLGLSHVIRDSQLRSAGGGSSPSHHIVARSAISTRGP